MKPISCKIENNRETWLQKATEYFRTQFESEGYKCPPVQVGVGRTTSKKAIGEAWSPKAAKDGLAHIYICHTVSDGKKALGILLHELVHATVGNEAKHGKLFRKCALAMGLEGKMTATTESASLIADLEILIDSTLGEYPHGALSAGMTSSRGKAQKNRHIKLVCGKACTDMSVRTTKQWIDMGLVPLCPLCKKEMVES